MRRLDPRLLLLAGTVVALFAVNLLHVGQGTDAQRDWLTARASLNGVSPYQTTAELADVYAPGWEREWSMESVTPRTPGAILLSTPLTLVDFYDVAAVVRILNVFGLAAIVWVAYQVTGKRWSLAGLPLLAVSLPMFSAHHPGNPAVAIVALVALAYIAPPKIRGVLLAVATMLRLWPALIFLVYRDRDTWRSGLLTVAAVEGAGWLLIRPAFGDVVDALVFGAGAAAIPNPGNASVFGLPLPAWLLTVVAVGIVTVAVRTSRFLPVAAAAVIVTPLSWPAYHAFLYPWLVRRPWLLAGWFIYPLAWDHLGTIALAVAATVWVLDLRARSGRRVADVEEYRPAVASSVG